MLRITPQPQDQVESFVIEGKLVGPWVDALRRAIEDAFKRSSCVELDLAGIRFATPAGARLLRELVARGATVLRSTHFVDELLRS